VWGCRRSYDIGRADDRPPTTLIRPSDVPLRLTARVSASGPLARPSELTFALSRLVLAHESRQAESSETPDSLCEMAR
jgi:hypothetical protein